MEAYRLPVCERMRKDEKIAAMTQGEHHLQWALLSMVFSPHPDQKLTSAYGLLR